MNKNIWMLAGIVAITGLLLPGCGCGGAADAEQMEGDGTTQMDAEHAAGEGHDAMSGGDAAGTNATAGTGEGEGESVETMEPRTFMVITYSTPAEERMGTTNALNGLRATLKAELDAVRGRLGKTADPAAKEADQKRAAELAQGLERMDRLIAKVGAADDVSWAQVRESSLKEAEEVRVWMQNYNMDNSI